MVKSNSKSKTKTNEVEIHEQINVVAYVRVSTDNQAKEDAFGIEKQKETIIDYCAKNNMNILCWYEDAGESGVKEERPALNEILYGEVHNPPAEAVVVAKSDRMARDIKLYFYYMMLLEKKSMHLISATEEVVNDESGLGNVYKSLMLFVAEQERKNINRRTMGGREIKAKKGGYSGGRTPYGYIAVNGKLVVIEEEAAIIRRIFNEHNEGKSLRSIANDLNLQGYKTHNNAYFSLGTIQVILGNERLYKGEYKYGDMDWTKGEHDNIL